MACCRGSGISRRASQPGCYYFNFNRKGVITLNQVSVFAENTKGALRRMTAVLAAADINIYSMLASDSAEFSIIRLIITGIRSAPWRKLRRRPATSATSTGKVIAVDGRYAGQPR